VRLLVTGGAGYIGGFTTRLLRAQGHPVTAVDDLSHGDPRAVGDAELVVGDFGDRPLMREVLESRRIEAVLHFAGLKSVSESWVDPVRYHEVNVEMTSALLDAMAAVRVGMLVYSGSCAVYGDATEPPISEAARIAPMNPYADSKAEAERRINAAAGDGLRSVILRYFNAAGAEADGSAGERLDRAENLIPSVMRVALGLQAQLVIHGTDYPTPDGTAVRDYIHVVDLAKAHAAAVHYLESGGGSVTLNVGTGAGTSVREVLAAAAAVVGRPIPSIDGERRRGDPAAVWASTELASEVLGWRAELRIHDIVETAWKWHSARSAEKESALKATPAT